MSIFTSNATFGSQLKDSFNSWMPGGNFGAAAGGIARGVRSGFNQLGNSMRESAGSWGQQRQPQQFSQQDFQLNDSSTRTPFGDRMSGDNMQGNAGGFSDGRFGAAYDQIGSLQRDIQNGRDGNSGQALDYFGRQEKQRKISELYKNTQNFDGETQRQLAQVQDEDARRRAAEALRNPRLHNGVANTNEMLQNEARVKWGVGAAQTYADGGRIGWGAGNQQGENLREAARRGVPVSNMLMDKGNFDARIFDQSQSIYNPEAGSAGDPFAWLGRSSYHSMGLGAGEGATNHGAVYGADPTWNPVAWGNAYEPGGSYSQMGGGQGQWDKFHKNNLSYGGGNFIGASPEQDANRSTWYKRPQTWGSSYSWPQGEGYWQEGGEYPRAQREFYRQQRIQEDAEAQEGYRKPIYDTGDTEGSPYKQIRSGVSDIGFGGAVGSGRLTTSNPDRDVFYEPTNDRYVTRMPPIGEEQFGWIDKFARDRGVNPDAYKPSRSSRVSSTNDVFDQGNYGSSYRQAPRQGDYQRLTSPYYNFADGFDNGYYNAQNDSTFGMGNYRPKSFWRTR